MITTLLSSIDFKWLCNGLRLIFKFLFAILGVFLIPVLTSKVITECFLGLLFPKVISLYQIFFFFALSGIVYGAFLLLSRSKFLTSLITALTLFCSVLFFTYSYLNYSIDYFKNDGYILDGVLALDSPPPPRPHPPVKVDSIPGLITRQILYSAYAVPTKMDFREVSRIAYSLSKEKKEFINYISVNNADLPKSEEFLPFTINKKVKYIEAVLHGSNFEISPYSNGIQASSLDSNNIWLWEIKALEEGNNNIYLVVNFLDKNKNLLNSTCYGTEILTERNRYLKAKNIISKILNIQVSDGSKWLWLTMCFPIYIYIFNLIKNRIK